MHYDLPSNGPLSRLNFPSLFVREKRFAEIVIALYLYKFRIGPISTHFHTEIHREIKICQEAGGETKFSIFWGELGIYTGISSTARACVCVCTREPPPLPPIPVTKSIRSRFRHRDWPFPTLLRIIFYCASIDQPSGKVYFRPSRQTESAFKAVYSVPPLCSSQRFLEINRSR